MQIFAELFDFLPFIVVTLACVLIGIYADIINLAY